MRIDINLSERRLKEACKLLGMLENMDFPEIEDSNKMDKIYQLITWAEEFRIEIEDQMEDAYENANRMTCPACGVQCIAPPKVFGCTSCGYDGERK